MRLSLKTIGQTAMRWRAALGAGLAALAVAAILAEGVAATKNPSWDIDPQAIFPSPASVLPHGAFYADTVPDTLDLARTAALFIGGAARTNVPLGDIWVPGGPALFDPSNPQPHSTCGGKAPCIDKVEGYPNWGKLALGFFLAREISGFDLDDRAGTVAAQHRSLSTMLSWDTVLALQAFAK